MAWPIVHVICDWISMAFTAIKVALEAGLVYAKTLITTLDSMVMSIENMIKNSVIVVLDAAIATFQIMCKYIVDWIMSKTHAQDLLDKLCQSLFKCSYVLKQLLNPNSPITKALVKNFDYDTTAQADLYSKISDFEAFKNQICANGFTFVIGLDYLKDQAEQVIGWVNEQVDVLTRCRLRVKKFLESYLYSIEDYGVADWLRQLADFFNCVLDESACASIATTRNFYKKCCAFFHIKDIGYGQFGLTDSWVKEKCGAIDGVTAQLNAVANKLSVAFKDCGITSKNLSAAVNAYNLADWSKKLWDKAVHGEGSWKKIFGIRAISNAWDSAEKMGASISKCFDNMLSSKKSDPASYEYSFDFVVEHSRINSNGGLELDDDTTLIDNFATLETEEAEVYVGLSDDIDEKELSKIYLSDSGKIYTQGYLVTALLNEANGTASDAEKVIAEEVINRTNAVLALADHNTFVRTYN